MFPDADQFMFKELRDDGNYQRDHYDAARTFVSNWACAVDGGAHVGVWSRLMATDFKTVYAFEPAPDTFEALTTNLSSFGCRNVETYQVALGHRRIKVGLTMDEKHVKLANTGARHLSLDNSVERTVRVETLDSFALPTLGFLKLDVEGSELFALQGADETVMRCRPVILFEDKNLWKRFKLTRDAPQGWLRQHRYRPMLRVGCDEIWVPE